MLLLDKMDYSLLEKCRHFPKSEILQQWGFCLFGWMKLPNKYINAKATVIQNKQLSWYTIVLVWYNGDDNTLLSLCKDWNHLREKNNSH